jgi:chromosomal replication initiation ATPase DnaA
MDRHRQGEVVEGAFNTSARCAVELVCRRPVKHADPLLILGDSGTGKTHLLRYAEAEAGRHHPQLRCSIISMESFIGEVAEALRLKKTDALFSALRDSTDLLLLDHMEILEGKPHMTSHFLDQLRPLLSEVQVIMVCCRSVALASTLSDWVTSCPKGSVVTLEHPDQEGLRRYAESEADRMEVELRLGALDGLLDGVSTFPEIQGRLKRLRLLAEQRR